MVESNKRALFDDGKFIILYPLASYSFQHNDIVIIDIDNLCICLDHDTGTGYKPSEDVDLNK